MVGKTPSIKPKGVFEYTSFCPLQTPIGFMEGSYRMSFESREEFDVLIPQFKLVAKEFLNKIPFFANVSIAFELIDFTP